MCTNCCAGIHLHYFTCLQFVSQWDRYSEVLSLWISNYKGTGEKKRVRRSLYNAVLQAGFPKVAVSLKVSLRFIAPCLVHQCLQSLTLAI